ncbi:MAG: glycosyltransferase family 39 protein [Candidatus Woesebacteria bacterium]|nr:MAG: glycosyltransferase family 39 protein [Candidatus Woesebacteria bacterium]
MIYLILVFGLALRLISLNQSLWLDEATSALAAKMNIVELFTKFLPGDFHPPLYYLILKSWSELFGYSEMALRFPSIIFGVFTIYIVYLIGKNLFNENVGMVASLFLATSGLHVYYSQEARTYSLAALLVTTLIYLFLKKKWILFSIILATLSMTDYISLLMIPVFWLFSSKEWKKLVLSHIPVFAVFAVWLPIFIKQLVSGVSLEGSDWWNILGIVTFKNITLVPTKFILGRISFDDKLSYAIVVLVAICLFSFLLFKARKGSKLLWGWLVLPIVFGVLISFKIPTLTYFRYLFCLPALYLLVSTGIENSGKFSKILLISIVSINIMSTFYYLTNSRFQREDWRSAAKAIGTQKIIFPANSQKEALIYYDKGGQIVNISDLNTKDKEIWLSRYVWEIFDPKDVVRLKIESLGYNRTQEYNFNGVVFYKYANSN